MPEGPELQLTMLYINNLCKCLKFSGKIYRNPIHKCADIDWDQPSYSISAESRGKELLLHLQEAADDTDSQCSSASKTSVFKKATSILFTFGMSGKFAFTPAHELKKHSHLTFFTKDDPKRALSFVDPRRFGKWIEGGYWSADRGPCVIQEYSSFVKNIVTNLNKADFNKPICEVMLNQKYFNGIGNYLRAEILFRCQVPPFVKANSVLQLRDGAEENMTDSQKNESIKGKNKPKLKQEVKDGLLESRNVTGAAAATHQGNPPVKVEDASGHDKSRQCDDDMLTPQAQELLTLCHTVPLEVVNLGSSKYSLLDLAEEGQDQVFEHWLQCYFQAGMNSLQDHNKRTIWFSGPAGPMVPTEQKSWKVKRNKKTQETHVEKTEAVADILQGAGKAVHMTSDSCLPAQALTDSKITVRGKKCVQTSSKVQCSRETVEGKTENLRSRHNKPQRNSGEKGTKTVKKAKIKVLEDDGILSTRLRRSAMARRRL